MSLASKGYSSEEIDVYFSATLCIHAAECVKGLPQVFDTKRRPWIDPAQGEANAIAQVIERCPSGALQYVRKDGYRDEQPDVPTTIVPNVSQQLVTRGDLRINYMEKELKTYRAVLCGCGQSNNTPFCDKNSICKEGGS